MGCQTVGWTKDGYREYKLGDAEVKHLNCMERKGTTPQVER